MGKPDAVDAQNDRSTGMTVFESRLVNLLGLMLVHERQQSDQIGLLGRAGFGPAEIAAMLGTTRNTVSVELSRQRTRKKSKKSPNPKRAK